MFDYESRTISDMYKKVLRRVAKYKSRSPPEVIKERQDKSRVR